MKKGVPAENRVLKENRAWIRLLEAGTPPMKVQPVLVGTKQAKGLHTNRRTGRKRKPIDEQRNPIVCAHAVCPVNYKPDVCRGDRFRASRSLG